MIPTKPVMNKALYFTVCKQLVIADLTILKQTFFDKYINLIIWVTLQSIVMGYVMPFFGLSNNFGAFQFGAIIAATGIFELFRNVIELVADLEGDRIINYSLLLPIPSWLAIISKAIYYFIQYFILALLIFPAGKILLWNQLDLTQIFYGKLLLSMAFQSLFYACFILWATSITASISKSANIWSRFIYPMWYMGGFQFSWMALYKTIPNLAIINLLNPITYITEAARTAILGQEGYINFWLCLLAITFFSAVCLMIGIKNLQKRLDFVW